MAVLGNGRFLLLAASGLVWHVTNISSVDNPSDLANQASIRRGIVAYVVLQLGVSALGLLTGNSGAAIDIVFALFAAYWLARASRGVWVLAVIVAIGNLILLVILRDWPYGAGIWLMVTLELATLAALFSAPLRNHCLNR
jgi:hypothetical protein